MGWLESGIRSGEAEDVAQHSFETSAITLLLADSLPEDIDKERALRMAVIHDWAEAVTGDISREISEQMGLEIRERIEEEVLKNLLPEEIPNREEYLDIWREYTQRKTQESKIVYLADKLSILFEARKLFREGENSEKLWEIWSTTKEEVESYTEEFPFLKNLLQKLEKDLQPTKKGKFRSLSPEAPDN